MNGGLKRNEWSQTHTFTHPEGILSELTAAGRGQPHMAMDKIMEESTGGSEISRGSITICVLYKI